VKKVDLQVGWIKENFGEKTAQGFFDRAREYTRRRFEANPEATRSPSARSATMNTSLPAADPQKTIGSPVSPQPAAAGATAAAPAEVAAGTGGRQPVLSRWARLA